MKSPCIPYRGRLALFVGSLLFAATSASATDFWLGPDKTPDFLQFDSTGAEKLFPWMEANGAKLEIPSRKGSYLYYRHESLGVWFGPYDDLSRQSYDLQRLRRLTDQLRALNPDRYGNARAVRIVAEADDTLTKLAREDPNAIELRWLLETLTALEEIKLVNEQLRQAREKAERLPPNERSRALQASVETAQRKVRELELENLGVGDLAAAADLFPDRRVLPATAADQLREKIAAELLRGIDSALDAEAMLQRPPTPADLTRVASAARRALELHRVPPSQFTKFVEDLQQTAETSETVSPYLIRDALRQIGQRYLQYQAGRLPQPPPDQITRALTAETLNAVADAVQRGPDGPALARAIRQQVNQHAVDMQTQGAAYRRSLSGSAAAFETALRSAQERGATPSVNPAEAQAGLNDLQTALEELGGTSGFEAMKNLNPREMARRGATRPEVRELSRALEETLGVAAATRVMNASGKAPAATTLSAPQMNALAQAFHQVYQKLHQALRLEQAASRSGVQLSKALEQGLNAPAARSLMRAAGQATREALERAANVSADQIARSGLTKAQAQAMMAAAQQMGANVGQMKLDGRALVAHAQAGIPNGAQAANFTAQLAGAATAAAARAGFESSLREAMQEAIGTGAGASAEQALAQVLRSVGLDPARHGLAGRGTPGQGQINAAIARAADALTGRFGGTGRGGAAGPGPAQRPGGATGGQPGNAQGAGFGGMTPGQVQSVAASIGKNAGLGTAAKGRPGGTAAKDGGDGTSKRKGSGGGFLPSVGPLFETIFRNLARYLGIEQIARQIMEAVYLAMPELFENVADAIGKIHDALVNEEWSDKLNELNKLVNKLAPLFGELNGALDQLMEKGVRGMAEQLAKKGLDVLTQEGLKRAAKELGLPEETLRSLYNLPQNFDLNKVGQGVQKFAQDQVAKALRDQGLPPALAGSIAGGNFEQAAAQAKDWLQSKAGDYLRDKGIDPKLLEHLQNQNWQDAAKVIGQRARAELDPLVRDGVLSKAAADALARGDLETGAKALASHGYDRSLKEIASRTGIPEDVLRQAPDKLASGQWVQDVHRKVEAEAGQRLAEAGFTPAEIAAMRQGRLPPNLSPARVNELLHQWGVVSGDWDGMARDLGVAVEELKTFAQSTPWNDRYGQIVLGGPEWMKNVPQVRMEDVLLRAGVADKRLLDELQAFQKSQGR